MSDENLEIKATWSAATINNLPDAAFAYIESGGSKDAEGKTTPRSLRHFPHHNGSVKKGTENGSVDLPHLRNALARAPQSPHGGKALGHLKAHARALLPSYQDEKALAFKVVGEEERIIEGYAATWDEDDEQETFDPKAFNTSLQRYMQRPVLLWRHGRDEKVGTIPVGRVLEARVDEVGLWVQAQFYKGQELADYAWNLVKQGARNFSVGAVADKVRKLGRRIMEWPLVEISVEDFAANPYARFEIVKGLYAEFAKALDCDVAELTGDEQGPEGPTAGGEAEPEPETGNEQSVEAATEEQLEVNEMSDKKETPTLDVAKLMTDVQETVTKTVTDTMTAIKAAEAEEAEAKAEREKEFEAEVQKRTEAAVEAAKKELAAKSTVIRRAIFPTESEKETALTKGMVGPYDGQEPLDMTLGYMVMKSAGNQPSLDYVRGMHGLAAKALEGGLLATKEVKADNPALKGMGQPVWFGPTGMDAKGHSYGDLIMAKALATKADELMGSDVSTYGDEWIPVFYSREVIPMIRNATEVLGLFRQIEVAGESLTVPVQGGTVTWYKTAQTDDAAEMAWDNAAITGRISHVTTSNLTLTPEKLSAIVVWTGELDEQSLVPMLPFLRNEMVVSGAEVMDELIISGDDTTGATNYSDYGNGAISASWRLLLFEGLRYLALTTASAANKRDGGTLTAEDFLATKKLMGTNGKYAVDPAKLVWLSDVALYWKVQALGEALTLDKKGAGFTFDSGTLERVFGSPYIPSAQFGATDSSGYIHNTTAGNTLGSLLLVRPDQHLVGFGRRMKIETERIARSDAYDIVAHMMLDFQQANAEGACISYNISV